MSDRFAFTDEQWRAYQTIPDQGYSHRAWLEHQFNAWLPEHDRRLSRRVWFEGASSRQCHCHAYEEGECACGMWPSEMNPYLLEASASSETE